jgi:S1-C subfamily serine protease
VAEKAGMKAGDIIVAVGRYPTHDDLMTFANDYVSAKGDAKLNETSTYPMSLIGPDGKARTANLAMPMRLRGGLMDGFSDKP